MEHECKLVFDLSTDNRANVELKGNHSDILFCLTGLTAQVCEELHIPPILYAAVLPGLMADHKRFLQQRTKIDIDAILKQQGGGTP